MSRAERRLDELLANLSPLEESCPPADSEHWAKQLTSTMARIQQGSPNSAATAPLRATFDNVDDVLKTPLPLEPDEPNPEFAAPAFNDVFDGAPFDFDPLRAPLKSGEHPQLIALASTRDLSTEAVPPVARRSRIPSYWLFGGATTLAAAAALLLYLRTDAGNHVAAVTASDVAHVAAVATPNQPNARPEVVRPAVVAANAEPLTAEPQQEMAAPAAHAFSPRPAALKATKAVGARVEDPSLAGEPPLVPAAGPSELPDHPTMGAISAALARRQSASKACLPEGVTRTQVRLTFAASGKVKSVVPLDPGLPPSAHACLSAALGSVQLAPFARAEFDATVPISRP